MSETIHPTNPIYQRIPGSAQPEVADANQKYQRLKGEYLANLRTIANIERTQGSKVSLIQVGAYSMHHFFQCLDQAPNKWAAVEDIRSEVSPEQLNRFEGAFGEFQIYNLINQINEDSGLDLHPKHSTVNEDLDGIDLWLTINDDLPEFKDESGKPNKLALAIKSVPLPVEINDVFYPARDEDELQKSTDSIIESYTSYTFGMPQHERNKNIQRITEAMSFAFHRLQGHEYNTRFDNWEPKYDSVNQVYGKNIIPTIALASNYTEVKRFKQRQPNTADDFLPQELVDTATYQLTDNPHKWLSEPRLPDGSPNPFFPYAA